MNEPLAPALTPEEFRNEGMDDPGILGDIRYAVDQRDLAKIIALANHQLPDTDPRKITWGMVDALHRIAEEFPNGDTFDGLVGIADALASYLPPRT